MSELKVEVVEIDDVIPHTNADRLELAKIKGWYCVIGKGQFKKGDRGIYFPIDSVLPKDLELMLFPEGSKIKLRKSRIRTEKIRGAISQGLVIHPSQIGKDYVKVGQDLTQELGVTKYEPEEESIPNQMRPTSKRKMNPHFKEYTDLQNAKNYPDMFKEWENVVVTEKIHGTNFRAGWVPYHPYGFWEKLKFNILQWLAPNRIPKYEFVYGSRRVQLQKKDYAGFYDENVYAKMVRLYNLEERIPHGYVVYGEIYGDEIQKGYHYGKGKNEHDLVVFEVMDVHKSEYLHVHDVAAFCTMRGLRFVPIVYHGPFGDLEAMKKHTLGPSLLAPEQKVREGVVVRSVKEEMTPWGRKQLKFISDVYLLGEQSDFH